MKNKLTGPIFCIALAFLLWTIMFSPLTAPRINFWLMMTCSAIALTLLAVCFSKGLLRSIRLGARDLLFGIAIAALLWVIFFAGDYLSGLMFDFARPQVNLIYGMKEGESPWLLAALMFFLIGPAEEIFWRGYIQKSLSARWNPNTGFIVTTLIYALVHAGSCNFMLTMAALVAGFVWGLVYRFFPGRLGALIVSHALWDCAIFIFIPV